MEKPTPVDQANAEFDNFLDPLQVRLAEWQNRNFGYVPIELETLGIVEEVGELAHAILKNRQGIRGMDAETFRQKAGDALADIMIYTIQVATSLRLDYDVLLERTAEEVMKRDWKQNPNPTE